jgi:hypothetical protein
VTGRSAKESAIIFVRGSFAGQRELGGKMEDGQALLIWLIVGATAGWLGSQYRLGETSLQETAHVEGIVNVVHAACAALSKLGKN